MSLAVVIPAFNEEQRIARALDELIRQAADDDGMNRTEGAH